jgi:predicted trehalose synthase
MPRIEDSGVAFLRHLRERGFVCVPALFGTALYVDAAGTSWVVATSQHYVSHPTDAESSLRDLLRAGTVDERLLRSARVVADGLAALHAALAAPGSDPTFEPKPISDAELLAWRTAAHGDLQALLDAQVDGIEDLREAIEHGLDALPRHLDAVGARAHGRLTLSRVLLVEGEPVFVGFGEPVAEKSSPLKDVASLTRSFGSVARETVIESGHDPTTDLRETRSVAREMIERAHQTFLARYFESAAHLPTTPSNSADRLALIRFFRMRGALRGVRAALARTYTTLPRALAALRAECSREPLA